MHFIAPFTFDPEFVILSKTCKDFMLKQYPDMLKISKFNIPRTLADNHVCFYFQVLIFTSLQLLFVDD